jgi:hypothetical protein
MTVEDVINTMTAMTVIDLLKNCPASTRIGGGDVFSFPRLERERSTSIGDKSLLPGYNRNGS